jgi:hypothetical protein
MCGCFLARPASRPAARKVLLVGEGAKVIATSSTDRMPSLSPPRRPEAISYHLNIVKIVKRLLYLTMGRLLRRKVLSTVGYCCIWWPVVAYCCIWAVEAYCCIWWPVEAYCCVWWAVEAYCWICHPVLVN